MTALSTTAARHVRDWDAKPACAGRPEPYDALMDYISGPQYRAALDAARSICGSCPLSPTCLRDNLGERWANAVLGRKLPAVEREGCGTSAGSKRHYAAGEETCDECKAYQRGANAKHRDKRVGRGRPHVNREEDLRDLVANGATISDACRALGVTRNGLQKWCGKYGLHDLYHTLARSERQTENQWTRGAA